MKKYSFITAVFSVLLLSASVFGQVNINTAGTPISQDFNTLTNGTWADNTTLLGWYARTDATATISAYGANTGTTTTAGLYAFGVAGTNSITERSLGYAPTNAFFGASGTGRGYIGWRLKNNTGAPISSITVTWAGEQWRVDNVPAQSLTFDYQTGTTVTSLTSGTFTPVPTMTFTSPRINQAASALDGNAAVNRTANISATITFPTPLAAGEEVMLRWVDLNDAGNDHFLTIDDVSVTATAASVTPNLTINDVSQSEGDAGTTNFTFTVSLSAPAPAGGVTFDIATADGTATDGNPPTEDNDYQANSLTGQTIPNGSSSYQFTVAVNGDTAIEPNETFFVNVTNVTGATVTDGQGQGTINNDDATSVQFAQPSYTVSEGVGTVTLTVTRTGSSSGAVSVEYAFAGITASGAATCAAGIDFAAVSGTLNWADGDTTPKTFNVTICDDALTEGSENFISQLQNPSGATIGAQSSTDVTITDNDSDTVAPVITYTLISNNPATTSLTATVTDAVGVTGVNIFWRIDNGSFTSAPCSPASGTPQDGTWTCIITGAPNPSSVAYYVTATDGTNTATNPSGGASAPNLFTIGSATIPAGTYTNLDLGNGVSLGGDVVVTGSLTLSGVVNTGANKLTLGCGVPVTGGGEGSYVVGRFERLFCGNETFTFNVGAPFALPPFAPASESLAPEGVVSNYSPLTVQITGGTPGSSLTVSVTDQFLPGSRTDNSASRFWTLTETGDLTANLSFTYRNEDVNGDESLYNVLRRSGGVTTRFDSTINPATNTATVNGITNFSDWAVGNLIPTAAGAEIAGRLLTGNGEGIRNATVMITGGNLTAPVYAQTGTFGNYKFSNLPVGQTYVVTVFSKRFTFADPSRVINLLENVTDENFVAEDQ